MTSFKGYATKHLNTILISQRKEGWKKVYTPQAKRIAWRQILRWVEAQLALVETGMVKIQEVFIPYMLMDKGKTLYEKLEETQFKMLEHK